RATLFFVFTFAFCLLPSPALCHTPTKLFTSAIRVERLCLPRRAGENTEGEDGRERFRRNPAKVPGAHGRPCLRARARRLPPRDGEDEARGPAHRARGG